jgi:oligopeptide/dipeptide ABC transporter ATP-binding protein
VEESCTGNCGRANQTSGRDDPGRDSGLAAKSEAQIWYGNHGDYAQSGITGRICDRVAVMYAGRVVESSSLSRIFGRPLHPYTKGLLELIPQSLRGNFATGRLPDIPGKPPDLRSVSPGCAFQPRCSRRTAICQSECPEELMPESDHRVSCFNHGC